MRERERTPLVRRVPPIVHEVVRGGGRPLHAEVRKRVEPSFGIDFSAVRIHTGTRAAESARAVNALAYTLGRSIVFDEGQYAPWSESGARLLRHELTHVAQYGNSGNAATEHAVISTPDMAVEREATHHATQASLGCRSKLSAPILLRAETTKSDDSSGRDTAGGLCLRLWVYGMGGRATWSGISQNTLDDNVRIKDEDKPILRRATADSTDVLDAIYFGEAFNRFILKIPDQCTVTFSGSFTGFKSCCNLAGMLAADYKGRPRWPRPGTASEFGIANDWMPAPGGKR